MIGGYLVTVQEDESGVRLDRWFKRHFSDVSHAGISRLVRTGQVRVDGARVQTGYRLEVVQKIRIPRLRQATSQKQKKSFIVDPKEGRYLLETVLHVDDSVIAINKPQGLAVQGGTGLSHHLEAMLDFLRLGARERPRLVHRLDKDTGGVMVLARNVKSAAILAGAFRRRQVEKRYWALVCGAPSDPSGEIDIPLRKIRGRSGERVVPLALGRAAKTEYFVVDKAGNGTSWLVLMPSTGRTHQIRAHCATVGFPIVGDRKYNRVKKMCGNDGNSIETLCLHSRQIILPPPEGGTLDVVAPLSDTLRNTWINVGFDPETISEAVK